MKYKIEYLKMTHGQSGGLLKNNTKYNKIKELGVGMTCTVYLVEDETKNKYAMKVEHILKKQIEKSFKYDLWRELEFQSVMYNKYPNHFMKIHDNWIDNKCDHKQDWSKIGLDLESFDEASQKFYKNLFSSPFCSIKIYSLVDITLRDLVEQNKLNEKQYHDIFIQCLYIMFLCNENGYLHRDWKMDNIGLTKTGNKFINIFGYQIMTHGYQVILLDYGAIVHKKYILSSYEKKLFTDSKTDLFFMFDRYRHNMIFNFKDFEDKYKVDTFNSISINEKTKKEIEQYLPKKDSTLEQYVYKLLYYEDYEEQLIGDKIKCVPPKLFLPLDDIKYLIKNIYDIKKCILFLVSY